MGSSCRKISALDELEIKVDNAASTLYVLSSEEIYNDNKERIYSLQQNVDRAQYKIRLLKGDIPLVKRLNRWLEKLQLNHFLLFI